MHHGQLLWLLFHAIAVSNSLGAYVESRPCANVRSKGSLSTTAALRPHEHGQTLSIEGAKLVKATECDGLAAVTVNLTTEGLGWRVSDQLTTNTTCESVPWAVDGMRLLRANVSQNIERTPLSTFRTRIDIANSKTADQFACSQVEIAPEIDLVTSRLLRWVPCAILTFVFVGGAIDSLYDHDPTEHIIDGVRLLRTETRPILPLFGDCLHYLQFVFLSGGLSISYPGFYRPAVSKLSWFSLFHSGPITHKLAYDGVRDGIYEVNGTYGGTYGLEIMHQIAATPGTIDTWFNMLVTILIITVCAGVILECLRLIRKPQRTSLDQATFDIRSSLRHRFASLLRVVFSYFTMPLIAMSFYQLANAMWLPRTHTVYAVFLIVYIAALFSWLLYQVPPRSLGRLLLNKSTRYESLLPGDAPATTAHDDIFVLVLFTLLFIRGMVVGGLQKWGAAQLVVLCTCEVVLLGCIYLLKSHPLGSVVTIGAAVRLIATGLTVAFLPGASDIATKTTIGRAILVLHAAMLLGGFFVPSAIRLVRLLVTRWNAPKADVYSLRQLRRRQTARTNLSPTPQGVSLVVPGREGEEWGPGAQSPQSVTPIPSRFCFRPPRSVSSRGGSPISTASPCVTPTHKRGAASILVSPIEKGLPLDWTQGDQKAPGAFHYHSTSRSSGPSRSSADSHSSPSQSIGDGVAESSENVLLVLPFNDYTTRESDAYHLGPGGRRVHEWGTPAGAPSGEVSQWPLFANVQQLIARVSFKFPNPFERKTDAD
ncbi:unnamed protein product [Clonostachys chloroleuca]|uniref:TRP C-terminal domain-containing protein n=1 Tax=Clonostachys chloroleuca TaxID=1926264 RepID=A0AA35LZT8_9HYPO|nr:unnamed protein product [Clonostachys chloroleuca]